MKPSNAVTAFAILALLGLLARCSGPVESQSFTGQSSSHAHIRDRHEFAKLLSSIKKGMREADVIRILGKPDDVRTTDEMQMGVEYSTEVWCFGVDGHLGFPTLGTIWFESAPTGKSVVVSYGGEGTPPPPSLFDEGELRKILSMLSYKGHPWVGNEDPRWAIKVVNTLAPLGKRKALAAIEEYGRVWPFLSFNKEEMSKLLRVLFDVPKETGYMPDSPFRWVTPPPEDRKRVPRFPMVILGDVPLQIATSPPSYGPDPDFAKDLAWFRDHATIRTKPLHPTDKPLQLFSEWKAYDWLYRDLKKADLRDYEAIESCVKRQLRQLVKTVYRGDIEKGSLSRPVRWDMKRNMYTFLDGTTLPETSEKKEKKEGR
jgi:hypothetical protein